MCIRRLTDKLKRGDALLMIVNVIACDCQTEDVFSVSVLSCRYKGIKLRKTILKQLCVTDCRIVEVEDTSLEIADSLFCLY